MAEHRSGGPHRKLRMRAQEGALFGGGRFGAGRAGKDRALVRKPAEFRPQLFQGRGNLAGAFAAGPICYDGGQAREGLGAARLRMCPGLDHKKRAARSKRKATLLAARPNRNELVFEIEIAELVENQQILALAILRATDQGDVALAGSDARES